MDLHELGTSARLPPAIQTALETAELDQVARWLLDSRPGQWDEAVADLADALADAFLEIDPSLTLSLLDERKRRRPGPVPVRRGLLEVDAAARAGLRQLALERADELSTLTLAEDPETRLSVLNNLGTFLKEAGAFPEATRLLNDALALAEHQRQRVTVLTNLATVSAERWVATGQAEDWNLALQRLGEAAALCREDTQALGNVWFNQGFLYARGGRLADADAAYAAAEAAFEKAGSAPRDVAYVRRARGALAGRAGRITDATAAYQEAVDLFTNMGDLDEAATTSIGLVMALATSGRLPDEPALENLLDTVRRVRPDRVPELLMNLGNIAVQRREFDLAERHFVDAARLFEAGGREIDAWRARHAAAVVLRLTGRASKALPRLREVLARMHELGREVNSAEVEFNLALVLRDLGSPDARPFALHAFEVLDAHRHDAPSAADRAGILNVTYPHVLDLALELARDDPDLVAALAERARTQTAYLTGATTQERLAAPVPVRARAGQAVVGGTGTEQILSELAEGLGGPGATWLTWVRHREQLLRIHVTPARSQVTAVPFPRDLLVDLQDATALQGSDGPPPGPSPQRAALYRIATGPLLADPDLADRLGRGLLPSARRPWRGAQSSVDFLTALGAVLIPEDAWAASAVVLAPPVDLGSVPWASLLSDGQPWVERADLTMAPPASVIGSSRLPKATPARKVWVADTLGDLRYCRRTRPGWEVLASDGAAGVTRAALLGVLESATHVVVRGHVQAGSVREPSTAGLVTVEGCLSAAELRKELRGGPPEWLILGCDGAGAATGSEWAGLPIGLAAAGAERLIVTQWPILDDPAQEDLDLDLVAQVEALGLRRGLMAWQRQCARSWLDTADARVAPHRWAGHTLVVTVTGSGSSSPTSAQS